MSKNLPQILIMLSGAILIVVGVVLIVVQFQHELAAPTISAFPRSLETSPSGGIKLVTTYVGLIVVGIGAALETVGYVATTPWRAGRAHSE